MVNHWWVCGYPIVSPQFGWLDGLYVTRPLAKLELGATAPNIHGARMAAERTYFQELTTPGSPHYLLDQPDYYCMQPAILATGQV